MRASSKFKFLRFVVGRHDLPFYYSHSADMQLSFFDSFLKENDHGGWKSGKQPKVRLCLRKGDCGVDDPKRELQFLSRDETDWPIPDTDYTKFYLTAGQKLSKKGDSSERTFSYDALNGYYFDTTLHRIRLADSFRIPLVFTYETLSLTEITGHIVAHLVVSCSSAGNAKPPSEIDLFVTLRKVKASGQEVFYTGTMGDPVPIVKGWQRVSLRKVDTTHPSHTEFLPYRKYYSTDVLPVEAGERYAVDVEIWPTNVVLEEGEKLVLEIAGHDTQGVGNFSHGHAEDRNPEKLSGMNHIHVGGENAWLLLPLIPTR